MPPASPYVCPDDRAALEAADAALRCPRCGRRFGRTYGILDLDVVRAADRTAFDERFESTRELTPEEIAASTALAARFLAHVPHPLSRARILDVACGNGALTYGLLTSPLVTDTDVYCFDHSIESIRVFVESASRVRTTNRVDASIQDVHRLAYRDEFLDVVLGSAVLHHFVEWETVLAGVFRVLRPGGVAVFAEPWATGYLWIAFLMHLAASLEPRSRGTGSLPFFVEDTFFRLEHHDDKAALARLTDKHFFLDDEVLDVGTAVGFSTRFAPFEPAEYYGVLMTDMLRTYGVENEAVARKASALYAMLKRGVPRSLHRLVPHFKFIILEKPLA